MIDQHALEKLKARSAGVATVKDRRQAPAGPPRRREIGVHDKYLR
jgi:hypothetical protein